MKLRVLRDFGFDIHGHHLVHGHEFEPADLAPALPVGASDDDKKAHAAAEAKAAKDIEDGKKKGFLEEAKPAVKPAEKEG